MSGSIRVFVDEQPVSVPQGATVRDAVAAHDESLARAIAQRVAYVTDGVGRQVAPDGPLEPGAILRVVRSAPREGGANP